MNPCLNGHRIPSSLIPPGSKAIFGSEAVVFIHGSQVTRIQAGDVNRPNIGIMLQPTSTSRAGAFTVEVLPYVQPANELPVEERRVGRAYILDNIPPGYWDVDLHHGNYGRAGNEWFVIDPHAIRKMLSGEHNGSEC